MEGTQGLARRHGSHRTGNVCTELLVGRALLKTWPKCKNFIFRNLKLSSLCGREVGKGHATSPCSAAVDALAGSASGAGMYHAPAQALQHRLTKSPPVLSAGNENHADLLS